MWGTHDSVKGWVEKSGMVRKASCSWASVKKESRDSVNISIDSVVYDMWVFDSKIALFPFNKIRCRVQSSKSILIDAILSRKL